MEVKTITMRQGATAIHIIRMEQTNKGSTLGQPKWVERLQWHLLGGILIMNIARLHKITQFRNIKIEQNPIALHQLIMEVQAVEVRGVEVQPEDLGKI
jgi:hypothetical protein